jgi:hypothetical protein
MAGSARERGAEERDLGRGAATIVSRRKPRAASSRQRGAGARRKMPRMRALPPIGAAATIAAFWLAAASPAAAKTIECQHPVVTGVEVSHLKHVKKHAACKAALALYAWENKDGHAAQLYSCSSGTPPTPVLKLQRFDGWNLSIASSGYFEMSRGRSSFYVSGTDFPLACN